MSGQYWSTPTEARSPSPPLDYLVDWHGDASPPKAPVLSTDMMEPSAPWNKTWSTAPASEEKSEEWFAFQPEKPRSPTQAARNTRPDITTLEDRTPANPVPLRPENLLEKTIHIIPSAAQKVDKKSYLGLASADTPATQPARVTAPAAQTQDTANVLRENVVRPPVSADNDQPPLWKNLTTRKEPGQVLENLGNGQWRVLLGEGETQRKMVFNDAQVAAMTGMFKPELEVFKAKNPPQKMAPTAEVPAATAPQNIPAVRADRPFGELDAEVARVAGKNRREYPRTAEQAIANFRADGQELTDREASMIYSKFSQEYPGLNKIPRVEPTPQVPLPESFNDTRPQMRAATPKEIDSWGLRKSLAQPTSPYGLGFGEPELPVTPPSQDNPPRLTWNNQYDRISNTSEQKLKVEGQWRVEDIPAFLKDPSLMHVTPAERQQLLNDVLRAAGEDYAKRKGYSRENFVAYQTFADHLRKEVSGLTTAGDHTEGLVNGVGEVSTGILRGTIAKAADGTMLEPEFGSDPSVENLRVPFGTVARQAGYWGQKGMDTVDTLWASGKGHDLEEGLADLEKDLAEGNLPFGDRDAFEAWIKKHSQQISQGQSTWYEAAQGTSAKINKKDGKEEVMDGDWLQGYARSNSLEAPQNASLLAEFIRTRDPAVWAQLTDNLKKTPRRAGIERDQQEHLENSSVVRFLTDSMGTVDYKEAMKQAGNPLDLASDFIPIVRGARMVSSGAKAASRGGKVVAGIKSVAGSLASDLAIDSLNQAVENPNSTLEDYLATGRDTVATALGLHAVGMAAGKVGQMRQPVASIPAIEAGGSTPRVFFTTHLEGEKAVSSTGATVLPVQGKMNLAAKGYPPAEVEQYINQHYDPENYRDLGGKDTVWLVTPSTSGKNIIPTILAERLAKDHGGIMVSEGLGISQAQQAKSKRGYLAKMAEPTEIEITDPLLGQRLAGKRVVIVDDIMTSGETTDAIAKALAALGIRTYAIAVIADVKGGELANKSQITELAKTLSSATGKPLSKVLEEVKLTHQQSRGKLVVEALREAREKPNEVYESISRKASTVRETARGGR